MTILHIFQENSIISLIYFLVFFFLSLIGTNVIFFTSRFLVSKVNEKLGYGPEDWAECGLLWPSEYLDNSKNKEIKKWFKEFNNIEKRYISFYILGASMSFIGIVFLLLL